MNTATKNEILEALFEAQNGLSIGWQLANVRDDAERVHLQAPIIAGQEAVKAAIEKIEALA